MVKKPADCSPAAAQQNVSKREVQRISLSIHCSAAGKSKWYAKWTSSCNFPQLGRPGMPSVNASLRVKLPRAILKLSLAMKSSVHKSRSISAVHKTVQFFGKLKTRKVCLRLSGCFRNLKERALLRAGSHSIGSAQHSKLVELEHVDVRRKVTSDESVSELASWVSRRRRCWQDQLTRQLAVVGTSPLLSRVASEKDRWAMVVRAGVVFWTVKSLGRLVIGAASSAVLTAIASIFVVGLLLTVVIGNGKINSALWKLWAEVVRFGRGRVLPQVMWTVAELVTRSGMLVGASALSIIISLFQRGHSSGEALTSGT